MIFESFPWKKEVERLLKSLRKWSSKPTSERAEFYIQRAVFLSAFILRKLMENRKVTDPVRDRSVRCKAYRALRPVSDRVSTFSGLADVNDDYDLTNPEEATLSCFDLMSEIMHSYVFKIVVDEQAKSIVSFLVNSYNRRDNRLLEIDLRLFESVLIDAIQDSVRSMSISVHPTSGKIVADVLGRTRRQDSNSE
ncbi:hypothetical protein ACVIIW_004915 [Bradyrhizobium sp. USDA 4449]